MDQKGNIVEWISVESRLPDAGSWVVAVESDAQAYSLKYMGDGKWEDTPGYNYSEVRYWTHLPDFSSPQPGIPQPGTDEQKE